MHILQIYWWEYYETYVQSSCNANLIIKYGQKCTALNINNMYIRSDWYICLFVYITNNLPFDIIDVYLILYICNKK